MAMPHDGNNTDNEDLSAPLCGRTESVDGSTSARTEQSVLGSDYNRRPTDLLSVVQSFENHPEYKHYRIAFDDESTNPIDGVLVDFGSTTLYILSSMSEPNATDHSTIFVTNLKCCLLDGKGYNKLTHDTEYLTVTDKALEVACVPIKLKSMDDLFLMRNVPKELIVATVLLKVLQISVLWFSWYNAYHSRDAHPFVKATAPSMICVRLFISLFLSFKFSDIYSETTYKFLAGLEKRGLDALGFSDQEQRNANPDPPNHVREAAKSILVFIFLPVLALSTVILALVLVISELCVDRKQRLPGRPLKIFLAVVGEGCLIYGMVAATCVVTKQQVDVVNSVINFVAFVLVLELNQLMTQSVSWKLKAADIKSREHAPTTLKAHDAKEYGPIKWILSCYAFVAVLVYLMI
jgi:hypothetical protein